MANILGIIAAVFVTFSIWIGFKNGQAKDQQKEHLNKEKANHKENTAQRDKLNQEIENFQKKYTASLALISKKMNEKDTKETEARELKEESDGLDKEIANLTADRDDYQKKVDEYGNPDKLIKELQDAKSAITALDDEITELKSKNDELTVKINNTSNKITKNQKIMGNHQAYKAQDFLNARIKAVYKNWGFVVINKGDAQGVTPRSTVVVKRGDKVIAELLVKNATNNSSTAEIVFKTLAEGEFVQVGDKVVAKMVAAPVKPEATTAKKEEAKPEEKPKEKEEENDDDDLFGDF